MYLFLTTGTPSVRQRCVENAPRRPAAVRGISEGRRESKGRRARVPRGGGGGLHGRACCRRLGHERVSHNNLSASWTYCCESQSMPYGVPCVPRPRNVQRLRVRMRLAEEHRAFFFLRKALFTRP